MNELNEAAQWIKTLDWIDSVQRQVKEHLRVLSREYDEKSGARGTNVDHLRRLAKMEGLL